MLDISLIIQMLVNIGQIFLQFSIIIFMLKIRVHWGITLAYSITIALLAFENIGLMLTIFYGSTFFYYFVISKVQIKLTLLAISVHLFTSTFINNIALILHMWFVTFFDVLMLRIIVFAIYVVLFAALRHFKTHIDSLVQSKVAATITIMLMLSGLLTNHIQCPEIIFSVIQVFPTFGIFITQFVVIYIVFILNRLTKEIQQHEFHRMYTDTLEESLDNLRMHKHAFRNIMHTLLGLCELKEFDKLESQLREYSDDFKYISNVGKINDKLKDNMPYLYGIVLAKAALSATGNIRFNIDILAGDFELYTVSEAQLSRMVGNLLNNAFEAASHVDDKTVTLRITNPAETRIKFEIHNSVNTAIDTASLTEKGYSTKEGHTGYGLHEIKSIVKKMRSEGKNVKFDFHCTDDTFVAELTV